MSFYYPLGLLGLIGIPVIIFIYIIKSKYTEQTVASTYLWELSEKFLKRRKPISKLTGIITLLLQLFAVLFVSLAIAHPVFTVRASANDIFIILDGSASMHMRQGNQTRFDIARQRIGKIIDKAPGGSTYTLVFAGDTTDVVFEGITDKEQAEIFVDTLEPSWTAADCASAVTVAQNYFDANRSAVMYLITDKPYEVNDALTLIDVSDNESNYAIYSYDPAPDENGMLHGEVISYATDAVLTVQLWVAETTADAPAMTAQTEVAAAKGEPTAFSLPCNGLPYAQLQLRIANSDALAQDNCVIVYDAAKGQDRQVLLVSDLSDEEDDAVYLRSAIRYAGKADVDVYSPENYLAALQQKEYGMVVFNGYMPASLPAQKAVWLIDAIDENSTDAGVSYREHFVPRDQTGPNSYVTPAYTDETGAVETLLTKDLMRSDIAVRTYAQYSVPRNFTSVLRVDGNDVVFAGLNKNNDRQVAFAFRIKDSDLGMQGDFLILVRNLMEYSFPSVLSQTSYVCGDTMAVNVVPSCEGIVLTSPSGKSNTLDTLGNDVCEVSLTETGTYVLRVKYKGKDAEDVYAYAAVPEAESASLAGGAVLLAGEREYNYSDGFYDSLLAFFIVIAALLLADWGVYCYEQYQLR